MTEKEMSLVMGGLLHDIGKVLYRQGGEKRKHSQIGYEFLRDEGGIDNQDILDCVRYHHKDEMGKAALSADSLAYIVYIADNIASAADRRELDEEESEKGFEVHTPLQPVFNILNENKGNKYYSPGLLNMEASINYPADEKKLYTEEQYSKTVRNISDNLKGIEWKEEYLDSLLEVLEANLSYIPAATSKSEKQDISLFDHVKLTAAAASCILAYGKENGITDYREAFYKNSQRFYEEKAFLLASVDMSGIQNFIYTIATKNALRTLRARSFYLEIMMEHLTDELLGKMGLSHGNLIYSGGGRCYMLLPNTEECRQVFDQFLADTNQWFLEHFQTALYIAGAYEACSSQDLKNEPKGSYEGIFCSLSAKLSEKKMSRYTPAQIIWLNHREQKDYTRECSVCRRIGRVNEDGVCPICQAIEKLSQKILYGDFFTVVKEQAGELPLPGGFSLLADDERSLKKRMAEDGGDFVRAYGKNRMYTGKNIARKLWTGSYTSGNTFEEFASQADGIDRIGVLRADVDNLGHAFVAGFKNPANGDRYVTLSRTATLSRQLSLFFKFYINHILSCGEYSLKKDGKTGKRNAAIVYSGGDDLFIVGAWNEVIQLAVDIRRAFKRYTEGTLTISAGIGVYHDSYPVSAIAEEVAELEDASKKLPGKNGVSLFTDGESHEVISDEGRQMVKDGTYSWEELEDEVIGEKFSCIAAFFDASADRGNAILYRLLELIRNQKERINFARYVYLLSRMEPADTADPEQKEAYRTFSRKMLQWIGSEKDRRQLKTAITVYVYLNRENGEEEHVEND